MAIEHHARVLVQAEALTCETQQGRRQYYPIIDDTLTADVQTVTTDWLPYGSY